MRTDHAIRILAGTLILVSLALGHWVSPWWLLLGAFVGLNLLQSGFTHWCLAEDLLRACGMTSCRATEPIKSAPATIQ